MSRAQNPREEGHAAGQRNGKKIAERENRIAAFGAIRRAVEVMRWHENNAKRLAPLRPDGLNEYEAKAIRRAIRAAIGSDKT